MIKYFNYQMFSRLIFLYNHASPDNFILWVLFIGIVVLMKLNLATNTNIGSPLINLLMVKYKRVIAATNM